MKNAFYFMLKALFVLGIFKLLYWIFGCLKKGLDKKYFSSKNHAENKATNETSSRPLFFFKKKLYMS